MSAFSNAIVSILSIVPLLLLTQSLLSNLALSVGLEGEIVRYLVQFATGSSTQTNALAAWHQRSRQDKSSKSQEWEG